MRSKGDLDDLISQSQPSQYDMFPEDKLSNIYLQSSKEHAENVEFSG